MIPTEKSPEIDEFLTSTFGVDRKQSITNNICTMCRKPATEFKDELSKREFQISGLCGDCQDEIFGTADKSFDGEED